MSDQKQEFHPSERDLERLRQLAGEHLSKLRPGTNELVPVEIGPNMLLALVYRIRHLQNAVESAIDFCDIDPMNVGNWEEIAEAEKESLQRSLRIL